MLINIFSFFLYYYMVCKNRLIKEQLVKTLVDLFLECVNTKMFINMQYKANWRKCRSEWVKICAKYCSAHSKQAATVMKLSFICKLIANFFFIFVLISPSSAKCFPTTLIFPDPHQANSHQANSPFSQLQPGGSAGHRVAMLESLKAGLVGADYCLIVLFRVAVK